MSQRKHKRNRKHRKEDKDDIPVPVPIPIPISYKEALTKSVPDELIDCDVKLKHISNDIIYVKTYPVAERDIIYWESSWRVYLNLLFYNLIDPDYHHCYDEFVEIAYLTTPYSYRKNRVARPNDTVVLDCHDFTAIKTPFVLLRDKAMMDGRPIFNSNYHQIIIDTDFSKYLYGVEPEYVPKFIDESPDRTMMEEEDIYFESKSGSTTIIPIEIIALSYDEDDDMKN